MHQLQAERWRPPERGTRRLTLRSSWWTALKSRLGSFENAVSFVWCSLFLIAPFIELSDYVLGKVYVILLIRENTRKPFMRNRIDIMEQVLQTKKRSFRGTPQPHEIIESSQRHLFLWRIISTSPHWLVAWQPYSKTKNEIIAGGFFFYLWLSTKNIYAKTVI